MSRIDSDTFESLFNLFAIRASNSLFNSNVQVFPRNRIRLSLASSIRFFDINHAGVSVNQNEIQMNDVIAKTQPIAAIKRHSSYKRYNVNKTINLIYWLSSYSPNMPHRVHR